MKHLLFILLCLPTLLFAQDDSKYLAGAVPEINGKVVFTKEINAPGLSQQQIYTTLSEWANKRFNEGGSRVLYSNAEEGDIACGGSEYLVFTKTALSLDRSTINYRLTLECAPGKCKAEVSGIRYVYNVSYQNTPEKYVAEEWITDKYALNKDKTKLARGTGKFREKTVDLVEQLFTDAQAALGISALSTQQVAAPVAPVAPTAPAAPVAPAAPAAPVAAAPVVAPAVPAAPVSAGNGLAGYRSITPDKIPGNIINMLREDWMLITAGNDRQFNMMTAGWGGLGMMFGKPVAFCFIAPTRHTYQLMEKNDTYTLSFYTEAYRDVLKLCGSKSGKDVDKVKESGLTPLTTPNGSKAFSEAWMIIECRKTVAQSITPEAITDPKLKEEWSTKQLYKMFIGEIINVWVK